MDHKLEIPCECQSCSGTGLYVGIGERDGAAVVCHRCKGSGEQTIVIEYNDFDGRKRRDGVSRVYRVNPGICIGEGSEHRLMDFGGVPYTDWLVGGHFPPGTEDRRHTCPAWFYQSADYSKKPDWDECQIGGVFSRCKHFSAKHRCWERWDSEQEDPAP